MQCVKLSLWAENIRSKQFVRFPNVTSTPQWPYCLIESTSQLPLHKIKCLSVISIQQTLGLNCVCQHGQWSPLLCVVFQQHLLNRQTNDQTSVSNCLPSSVRRGLEQTVEPYRTENKMYCSAHTARKSWTWWTVPWYWLMIAPNDWLPYKLSRQSGLAPLQYVFLPTSVNTACKGVVLNRLN